MDLVMSTENARALAVIYGQRSDEAIRIANQLTTFLERAMIDDTWAAANSLTSLSEDLDVGDMVLRHQADVMDGLTVDVDALSDELGVEAWEVNKQLKRMERGDITAGELLVSIVDFGQTEVTGLDTTVRDFVPDAPPLGEDPELDALIQRIDSWMLSIVVDGRSTDGMALTADREADIAALAERMGMPDLATVMVDRKFQVRRFPNDSSDTRTRTRIRSVPLPTSEYAAFVLNWVTERLVDRRKTSRVVDLPTIGDLFDLSKEIVTRREKFNGGDNDEYDVDRVQDRSAQGILEEVARINAEWNDLAWLPAVLAGQATLPPTLASDPALQARVVLFARKFGFDQVFGDDELGDYEKTYWADIARRDFLRERADGGAATALDALTFLTDNGVLADALEAPAPIQKARLPINADGLASSIEFGRQQGVVTEDLEANASKIGLHLSGLDPHVDPATIDAAELDAEAPELDMEELVGLIATAIPPERLPENRLVQAVTFIGRAKTVGERIDAVRDTILGLKTVTTVGEPAMTQREWITNLPPKIVEGGFKTDIQGEEFNWLLDRVGVPGYHKSPDWRRGGGKRLFHLVVGADGSLDDFVVEKVPKSNKWGMIIMSVAKVAISIVAPPLGVAIAVFDAAMAAKEGDWTGAIISAVGALAAGAGAWASSTASAASNATSATVTAADAVAKGTGSIQALNSANQAFIAADSAARLASTVSNAAQFANAGVRAGFAFADGDVVGGIVNSVTAIGAGASGFGYGGVGEALATGASAIEAVDTTVDAIEDDDIAGAVAGGLGAASTVVDLTSGVGQTSGTFDGDTVETLDRVSDLADDAAKAVHVVDGTVGAIQGDDIAGAVTGGLAAGASLVDLASQAGAVSGQFEDGTVETLDRLAETAGDLSNLAGAGAGIARGIEEERWASLVGSGLRFGSSASQLVGNQDGFVSGMVFDRADEQGFARSTGDLADYQIWADSGANLADGGLAIAEGDYLGGTALLSGGTSGLLRVNGVAAANLDRLESLAQVADKVATAGPGLDHQQMMDLIGDDMQSLVDSFEASPEPSLPTGSPAENLAMTQDQLAAAEAELAALDQVLAVDPTGGVIDTLLGTGRSDLEARVESLRAQEASARETYAQDLAAQRQAAADQLPSHLPAFKPDFPSHLPFGRPDDLVRSVDAPGSGPTITPEQRAAALQLDRTEQLAALELEMLAIRERLNGADDPDQAALGERFTQLQKRRDGLQRAMQNPASQDRDFAQWDGSRFIVDHNGHATSYYRHGSEHDSSAGIGPRDPVVLGPGTMGRIVASADFQSRVDRIVDGITSQPGAGSFEIDRTWDGFEVGLGRVKVGPDFHIGRTQIDYWTKRNDDGTLTTTFQLAPGDGIQDVKSPPGAPRWLDEWLEADGLGPNLELEDARPYLYDSVVIDRITYADHGQGLASGGDLEFGKAPIPVPRSAVPSGGANGDAALLFGETDMDEIAASLALPSIDPPHDDGARASAAILAGVGAGIVAGTPALKGTPYHPDTVGDRVAPKYEAVHERPGYIANPRKSPEPLDAKNVYESRRLVRTDTETWWGRSEDGKRVYRYRSSQSGEDGARRVHWNGDFEPDHKDVPKDVKRSSTFMRTAGTTARVLGPVGLVPMFFDFKDMVDQINSRPPDA